MISDEVLDRFIHKFFGYGNLKSDYWFIGKEEGGGDSIQNISKRVNIWSNRGEEEVEDLYQYHLELKIPQLFGEKAKLQPTWNKLIRMLFSIKGVDNIDSDSVRKYQGLELGRKNNETCLLELMPIASKSTSDWLLKDYSGLEYLRDRQSYFETISKLRTIKISEKIVEFSPKFVVFYSVDKMYMQIWHEIAGVDFIEVNEKIYLGKNNNTVFCIVTHPTAFGASNRYFNLAGKICRDKGRL